MMNRFNMILFGLLFLSCISHGDKELSAFGSTGSFWEHEPIKKDSLPFYCNADVTVGAGRMELYLSDLHGKRVGVVANQSSIVSGRHLVDTLLASEINVVRIFSPEHGFRGGADAGEKVDNTVDDQTGLPIISLYGSNKKPKKEQLTDIDVLVFDLQDVGVRFYTYISTLHYIMEAAAAAQIPVIVLDRPNPNGHYVDGPVLKSGFTSFVGMHNVPVVHGMSIGEYALLINGEGWLGANLACDLKVIPCAGWDHTLFYEVPIAPSPNLPNMAAIYLYPSLCFFEGTTVSIGRGTTYPFQVVGHPDFKDTSRLAFAFTPQSTPGAKQPKLENTVCYGIDLHQIDLEVLRAKKSLDLSYLIEFYTKMGKPADYFLKNNFINLLYGSDALKKHVIAGVPLAQIEKEWQVELEAFKEIRKKYLLYTDF